MRGIRVAALAGAMFFALAGPVLPGQVTLGSNDGSLGISGELVDFDGDYFRLETTYGPLTVAAAAVTCVGAACPVDGAFVPEFAVSAESLSDAALLQNLLRAFAQARGLLVGEGLAKTAGRVLELSIPDGAPVLRFIVTLPGEEGPEVDAALNRTGADGDNDAGARRLALDAAVIALHPDAPVWGLTVAQIEAVLTGRASRWADLGGPDRPLVLHLPKSDFLLRSALGLDADQSPPDRAIRHAEPRAVGRAVSMAVNAVGVTRLSQLGGAVPAPLIGSCGIATRADASSIKSGDYPFAVPVFLHLKGPVRGIAGDFLEILAGPEAQDAVRAAGLVDLEAEASPLSQQGARLARAILATGGEVRPSTLRRMVRFLEGANRLSPTFRFRDGSTELDASSRANVMLVARRILAGGLDGAALKLAGFSDGLGSAAANLALSRERAETVREAILAALPESTRGGVKIEVDGFGEAMPIACDEDEWGRHVNRRVEFWVQR